MKTSARQAQLALLIALLALGGFTIHAQRRLTSVRSANPELTWGAALAMAFSNNPAISRQPEPATATTVTAAAESATTGRLEPAQSGGSFNIAQAVIAGGGAASSGGNFNETGSVGQPALGSASGGIFSVSSGFWQGTGCTAPAISSQPNSQTVCVGSAINWMVTVTGTGLSYQWRKNSAPINGATSIGYTIATAAASDAAQYDVVITGSCGTITSNAVTLTVNAGATIAQQPASQTICVTQPASLSVNATGTGLTYQWRKGGAPISGATTSSLNIPAASLADTGIYDVVITAACGSLISSPATLTVNPATTLLNQPANQTVCPGAPFSFTVAATGAGLTYQWRKNGVPISGATGASYAMTAAGTVDTGNYDVVITGLCGTATSNVAVLTVNPATVITTQPSNQTACPGGPATFSALATGANLTYQWRKNGMNIPGATASTYVLAGVTANDASSYDVIVSGACGTATSTAATLTLNSDTVIVNQPANQTVCPGQPASFSVSATGSNLIYQWRKNGSNISGATGNTYAIPAVTVTDAAQYDAVVTGACGPAVTVAATLTVNPATTIAMQPVSLSVIIGQSANFSVNASGTDLSYQWRKNGANVGGAIGSSFSLNAALPIDAGNYDVVVTGACGTQTSNAATLTVNCQSMAIDQTTLPNGQLGASYSQQLTQTGGNGAITWSNTGILPNNLTLNPATGLLSGAPTASGTFNFTVRATDVNNCFTERTYSLTIGACPTITIMPATLPGGLLGAAYHQPLTATGGTPNYTFTLDTGALPTGLSLSIGGALTGLPDTTGTFNFTIRVTDTNTCTATRQYTVIICAHIMVNPATLANGFQGTAYSQTLTATGGTAPYTFAVTTGALPGGLNLVSGGALTGTPMTPGSFNFTVTATDNIGCTDTRAYIVIIGGNGLQFYPLPAPVRLLDTRNGATACSQPNAPITGGTARTQPGRNLCTIPANAAALTGNLTTVQSGGGYLTLFPSDAQQPTVASTNYGSNEIINNVFTVGLGAGDGAFKIFALNTTDVVVDVTGYYAPPTATGLYFHPLPAPVRLLETRAGQAVGCVKPGLPLTGNADSTQQASSACTGIPAGARAIVGNATTVGPLGDGYLTLFPGDALRPLAASSNYNAGQIVNGPFAVGLASNGQFKIYTTSTTDLVVDVLGYYSPEANDVNGAGLLFTALPKPIRLLETRANPLTLTGCFKPNAPLNGNQVYTQPARGLCEGETIPAAALAVVGNATVVFPVSGGYLTMWPSNAPQPTVATSNYNPGGVINRHFIVGLENLAGAFNMFSFATTQLVIDLSGYFAP